MEPTPTDWPEIRARYESSGESLRLMAERFDVPFDTIKKRSSREKWLKVPNSEMAPTPENGTNNGTGTAPAAENGTAEMAPLPGNGTNDGTGTDLVANNGTADGSGTAEMAPVPKVGSTGGRRTCARWI